MAKEYLDKSGLQYLWGKLKDYFQVKLVSGTNIKTINNTSILGSGDITISSGGVTLPVGSVYESVNDTNPSSSLGNTWEYLGHSSAGVDFITDDGDTILLSDGDALGFAIDTYKFVRTA